VNSRRFEPPARVDDFFRLLAGLLAPYLAQSRDDGGTAYYDQGNSPLGRRQHLDLVRRGVLLGHKAGRKVLVRRDVVDTYVENLKPSPAARATAPDEPLSDWGLKRGGRK
jgi:hypothetical protein